MYDTAQVVKIPWPSNSSYDQLTPSHVTVKRCSGGCHGGLTSCVPTSTQMRKVSVLLARWVLGFSFSVVDLVVQGAPLVAALARRSVPPWRWRTSLPVGVAVAWNLPAVGPRTRSGGRRRAAASAGTPRPPRPACREVELGITSLASASAHPRIHALRITPTTP